MDIVGWYNGLPRITRAWFGGTVLVSLVARFRIIRPETLMLDLNHVSDIWRPVTDLLYYPILPETGMKLLLNLLFLVQCSTSLEIEEYGAWPADYAFMFLINWTVSVILSLLLQTETVVYGLLWMGADSLLMWLHPVLLMEVMIFSTLYVWANLPPNNNQPMQFMFGIQIPARTFPWIMFALSWIIGGTGSSEFIGLCIGYLYFQFKYVHPIIHTPLFLERFFPPGGGGGI